MMANHSGDRSLPSSVYSYKQKTVFLNFQFFVLFSFFGKICPDDDCRTTVETSAYLLLSILSVDNDLLYASSHNIIYIPICPQIQPKIVHV